MAALPLGDARPLTLRCSRSLPLIAAHSAGNNNNNGSTYGMLDRTGGNNSNSNSNSNGNYDTLNHTRDNDDDLNTYDHDSLSEEEI